ncbi:hypothetical protein HK414_25775 [Ramlibacter terrae]|uniref:Uncharacterized protein n=1 Tax=Ramlibacter terrae TaxID=2732511 RepID=A0ABX6P5S5_9BURK|nr:hypothetical protein HK414_25775 [Ramlibacter terrae]
MTLDVLGGNLLHVEVDRGAVNALVRNGGFIQADGGGAADDPRPPPTCSPRRSTTPASSRRGRCPRKAAPSGCWATWATAP